MMASGVSVADDPLESSWASTNGALVYAIGDVHGRYDLFAAMLAQIRADAAIESRGRRPTLVLLGDYVDRGPDSARVLTAISRLKRHDLFELRLLMGNHEDAFLEFIDRPEHGRDWLEFGGRETLISYGVEPPAFAEAPEELAHARDSLLERMPVAHLTLLRELELVAEIGDYAFVHAGVRPHTPLARQSRHDLLWIRDEFLDAHRGFDKRIVHGHSWVDDQPVLRANRIGIDTGAYETGVLTAIRLDGTATDVLQSR